MDSARILEDLGIIGRACKLLRRRRAHCDGIWASRQVDRTDPNYAAQPAQICPRLPSPNMQ